MGCLDHDVLVVGGGPAGAATAITLARNGFRVVLAESKTNLSFKIGESLPPAATPLLRDLGVLETMTAGQHLPCPGNLAAWGSNELVAHDFIRDPHGFGWHLDRARFDADLRASAAAAGAEVRLNCQVQHWLFEEHAQLWHVALGQGDARHEIAARWMVDATGRRAFVASACGAKSTALSQTIAHHALYPARDEDLDHRTCIEATPCGWWYTALVPGRRRLIAFFSDADLTDNVTLRTPEGFKLHARQTNHISTLLPEDAPATVETCSAHSTTRDAFTGCGWLAVGDATFAFDPLSSQGLFHALYTGLRGGQAVADALNGDDRATAKYQKQLRKIERHYQAHLTGYYSMEKRWPHEEFWSRRSEH